MGKKRVTRPWESNRDIKVSEGRYGYRLHFRWSQLEADRSGVNVGSPCRPRRKVVRTLKVRSGPRRTQQTLATSLRRQARFRMVEKVYHTIDYNTFSKNGVVKLTEIELYFLSSRMTRGTSCQWAVVYLGVGNGERFRYLRDEFFPELHVIAFDPLEGFFAMQHPDIEQTAARWTGDGTNFTFLLRCYDEEKDTEWIKSAIGGRRLLFISDIRGINRLEDGATFDKELDQEVQWSAIKRLRPEASLVKFTFPDPYTRFYTYVPGTLLLQTFCYYPTAELRMLIEGVPENTVEYDTWDLIKQITRHHERSRGQVYRTTRRSDRADCACLDHCFDCTVLWNTVSEYALRSSLDPYEVMRNLLKNHLYGTAEWRWTDVEYYLNHGRLMEAIAALEHEGPGAGDEADWSGMARALASEQPSLSRRLALDLPRPASRADLVRVLRSLSKPFTLLRTEVNGLLEYPLWTFSEAAQAKMEQQRYARTGVVDPAYYKTKPCFFFERGCCQKGDDCPYIHGDDDRGVPKLRPCWYYARGYCYNGDGCAFTHGDGDLGLPRVEDEPAAQES